MLTIFIYLVLVALVVTPLSWWGMNEQRRRTRELQVRKSDMAIRVGRRNHGVTPLP